MMRSISFGATFGVAVFSLVLTTVAANTSASHGNIGTNAIAQDQGVMAAPPANFGSPPSGQYPILYNDHHVYSRPDILNQSRVLAALLGGGTFLIPLRSMFEQMGATVSYDTGSKTVTVSKAGAEVKVIVGKPEVIINGESRPLDVAPIIYQGTVLVPVRVISEGMGAYVQWVPDRRIVVVRYVPPTPPAPPPTAAPPPPPPPPLPGPISDSTFEIYDASHPEYGLLPPHVFYGRYSYVLMSLNGNDALNTAMLEALIHRFVAPGRPIVPGIPLDTDNPHEFNLFEVPVLGAAWNSAKLPQTDAARAVFLKSAYDWNAAIRIRNSYCNVVQHANFPRICAQPRDSGPLIVTFFAPIPKLSVLRPAFAYDFSNVPSNITIIDSVLDVIQKQISIPQGVSADTVLPPSEQLKIAQVLEAANAALVNGGSHILAFAEQLQALKKLLGG
jgi:hypothetical protein